MEKQEINRLQDEARKLESEMDERRQRLAAIRDEISREKRDDRPAYTSVTIDADGRFLPK